MMPTRCLLAAVPILLALMVITGCATAPKPRAPAMDEGAITATPSEVTTPAPASAPVAARDPMLVGAANATAEREKRLAALSRTPQALPASEHGYYFDVLFAQLRQVLGSAAQIERTTDAILVRLPPEVTFEVASAALTADAEGALVGVLTPLADYRSLLISVHGHTDATGPAEVNLRLSAQRALTVANALRALGLPADQLMAIGFGSDQPKSDNATPDGRQLNRRVELQLEVIRANSD